MTMAIVPFHVRPCERCGGHSTTPVCVRCTPPPGPEADTVDLAPETLREAGRPLRWRSLGESSERRTAWNRGDEREVLELLEECQGGLELAAICEELDRSRSWVQRTLAALLTRRLVRRESALRDRRGWKFLYFRS